MQQIIQPHGPLSGLRSRLKACLLAVAWAACQCAGAAQAADVPATEQPIKTLPQDWYPESMAMGTGGTMYVGSWRQGAVARLRPGQTEPEVLVPPGSNGLANTQGVLVDEKAHLLWVCSGSMGFSTVPTTPSALKSYDLHTGSPRGNYPLPEGGYCNDLVQDPTGNIYVTDTYRPRILKLTPGAMQLQVWLADEKLGSGDTRFFLNGIALTATGQLYVSAVLAVPYVLLVDVLPDGQAGTIHQVEAPRVLKNVDALRYLDETHLVLFESNAFGKDGPYGGAVTLAEVQGQRITSLTPLATGLNDPSSGLIWNGRLWFMESKYSLLFTHPNDDAAIPRHVPFALQSVALPQLSQ